MSMTRSVLSSVVVLASLVTLSAQKQSLTNQDKADAVREGLKEKEKLTGLSLLDSGRAFVRRR